MSSSPTSRRIRRQLLVKPGFTRLPVCPHCLKEIELLRYAEHTRESKKAPPAAPQKAPKLVKGVSGNQSAPKTSLIYALFDQRAVARLERAGAEILGLRQELREKHDTLASAERVERCREIARRECLSMAIVVAQLRLRFSLQGSGTVFLKGLRPHIVDDHLREACTELVRMTNPTAWRST